VDSNVSAWTVGSSIFTFASLYILFIAVAAALYIVYTKPEFFPGHRAGTPERPAIYTPRPGVPASDAASSGTTASGTTASGTAASATEKAAE